MPLLHIALQEGFGGDDVVVRINGVKIYENNAVSTRTQIGLADSFEVDVVEGVVMIDVNMGVKDLSRNIELHFARPVYLGISVIANEIVITEQFTPFGYL